MKRYHGPGAALRLLVLGSLAASVAACSTDDVDPVGTGGTTTGTGGSGSGGLGSNNSGGTGGTSGSCAEPEADPCDFAAGVEHVCKRRFALGVNMPWVSFGADFGGIPAWAMNGVATNPTAATMMEELATNGVSVVRWWMFPDFRGAGIEFDENDVPTGLSTTAVADIQKALELADLSDLYITFTLFSFDNFRATRTDSGVEIRSITPLIQDAVKRQALIDNVVRPVAKAVAESPYASRLFGWDIINEPEWAILSQGLSSNDFDPNPELDAVSLADMKSFMNEAAAALGEEAPGTKRSIGWAAAKWAPNFTDLVGIEFNQPHIYSWVHEWWPYTLAPAALGYPDLPTIMGEFYLQSMPLSPGSSDTYDTIVSSWYEANYAGAWGWRDGSVAGDLSLVQAIATKKGCTTAY